MKRALEQSLRDGPTCIIFIAFLTLALSQACAPKSAQPIAPATTRLWQANEAVIALGTVQHVAIALNAIQRCEPPPNAATCAPVVSDANTGIVVDAVTDALTVIKLTPEGWRATAAAALLRIEQRLDAAGKGKLSNYVTAARAALAAL